MKGLIVDDGHGHCEGWAQSRSAEADRRRPRRLSAQASRLRSRVGGGGTRTRLPARRPHDGTHPARPLMIAVGVTVILLSLRTSWTTLR
jgi:hypothetical protein